MLNVNKFFYVIFFHFFFISNIIGQPYIFYKNNIVDTIGSKLVYDIEKLDLGTDSKTQFIANAGSVDLIKWDQTQNWLVIGNYDSPNYVINCNDTTKGFYLPIDIGGIGAILYSESKGRIFIFSSILNSNEAALSVFDESTQERIHYSILPYRNEKYNILNEEAFFSQDEDFIYFALKDSLTGENKVMKISTLSYEIAEINNLSHFGFPNADGYILHRGVKGKGIIQSFFRNVNRDQYYKIMDFDSDSSSAYIYCQGFFNPYLLGFGEYLVLEKLNFNNLNSRFYSSGIINIYSSNSGTLITSLRVEPNCRLFFFDEYPNNFYYSIDSTSEVIPINVDTLINPNLLVTLTNSQGTQITASNVKYYDTSWKDATDNGDGTFTVITTKPTVSVRVFYEGANQTVNNVPAQNNTYTFQTVNAAVELRNSSGNLIDEGTVQYYAGAWKSFGATVNGVANKELLPINYSFRMTYEYGSIDKQQDISVDPTVVFQTVNAAVELRNSSGNLIDEGTVQYYAGAWREFGTTINGVANKELLPKNYSFRMTYEYVSNDKQRDLSTNSTVTFSTVLCTLKVTNANNQPLEGADTKYYSGAWRDIGLTNANGEITKELLPKNLSFRAIYGSVSQDEQQDIGANNLVEIQLNTQ